MADVVHPAAASDAAADRYVVVARRYRPKGFGQLVGQEHVARALTNAIQTNRVGHAYLFTGARGVGKTSTARIFAKALNAPGGPSVSPDESSDICQAIDAGEDIDVLEIDGASNRGIDEIRQLRAGVGVRPSRARYKIYIIDEVHMLTNQAFNALLKTLEEPPEHVKFIMCTTDPDKLPITVLSRCQRFDFAPVRVEQIAGRLREIVDAENAEADDDALKLLARRASGSMRDSQSLLEQVLSFASGRLTVDLVHSMLGTADDARMTELADALAARDAKLALELVDAATLGGVDAGQLTEQLLGFFRDMMTAAVGCDAEMLRYCGPAMHDRLVAQGRETGLQTILGIVGLLDQTLVRIRQSVHAQVLLEAAVVQICSLPDLQAIASLAAGLSGGSGVAGGRAASPGSAQRGASVAAEKKNDRALDSSHSRSVVGAGTGSTGGSLRRTDGPSNVSASPSKAIASTTLSSPAMARVDSTLSGSVGPKRAGHAAVAVLDEPIRVQGDAEVAAKLPLVVPREAEWSNSIAQQIWHAAIAILDDMTVKLAKQALAVEAIEGNRLLLKFNKRQELAKQSCEEPERKTKLQAAIKRVSARDVLVECETCNVPAFRDPIGENDPAASAEPKAPKLSTAIARRQRLRDAEQHPFVRQVMDVFEAEIIRVDDPQG